MTCGDTVAQWVPPTLGSVYSGTIGSAAGDTAIVAVFSPLTNLAVTTIGGVPHTGVWILLGSSLVWTAALNGSSYTFQVSGSTCSTGRVQVADGGVADPFGSGWPAHVEKVL